MWISGGILPIAKTVVSVIAMQRLRNKVYSVAKYDCLTPHDWLHVAVR
jgi:hypothetical protein